MRLSGGALQPLVRPQPPKVGWLAGAACGPVGGCEPCAAAANVGWGASEGGMGKGYFCRKLSWRTRRGSAPRWLATCSMTYTPAQFWTSQFKSPKTQSAP